MKEVSAIKLNYIRQDFDRLLCWKGVASQFEPYFLSKKTVVKEENWTIIKRSDGSLFTTNFMHTNSFVANSKVLEKRTRKCVCI